MFLSLPQCRYINAARHISEQNVELFFEEGQPFPYFRTIRNISRHTEVLANFGNEFRKGKYVNLVNVQFNLPLPQPLPREYYYYYYSPFQNNKYSTKN
jgi:hypothetical protein